MLLFVIGSLAVIWEGFVLTKLWAWFVAPQFGLPFLGIAQGVGIAAIASMLTHQLPSDAENRDGNLAVGWSVVAPLIALLLGWAAKQFL